MENISIQDLSRATGYHRESIAKHRQAGRIFMRLASNPKGGIRYMATFLEAEKYIKWAKTRRGKQIEKQANYKLENMSDAPKRNHDCGGYSCCLDKAARVNRRSLGCKACIQKKINPEWRLTPK